MKRTVFFALVITSIILSFVLPTYAMEKLPPNASEQQVYERFLEFRKRIEGVSDNELDYLYNTIATYLGANSFLAERLTWALIDEAKAQRGNPSAQLAFAKQILNGGYHEVVRKFEAKMTGRELSVIENEYVDKASKYLSVLIRNNKATYAQKYAALMDLGHIKRNQAYNAESVFDSLRLYEQAKQYYTQAQQLARKNKHRGDYDSANWRIRNVEERKQECIKKSYEEKQKQKATNKLLQ